MCTELLLSLSRVSLDIHTVAKSTFSFLVFMRSSHKVHAYTEVVSVSLSVCLASGHRSNVAGRI